MIVMAFAESLGLIMHCEKCMVCVALWSDEYWTADKDGIDRQIVEASVPCWSCNETVILPTAAEVAEFALRETGR